MKSDKTISVNVSLPHHGPLVVATPEHPLAVPTSGTLTLSPQSAALIMEK